MKLRYFALGALAAASVFAGAAATFAYLGDIAWVSEKEYAAQTRVGSWPANYRCKIVAVNRYGRTDFVLRAARVEGYMYNVGGAHIIASHGGKTLVAGRWGQMGNGPYVSEFDDKFRAAEACIDASSDNSVQEAWAVLPEPKR